MLKQRIERILRQSINTINNPPNTEPWSRAYHRRQQRASVHARSKPAYAGDLYCKLASLKKTPEDMPLEPLLETLDKIKEENLSTINSFFTLELPIEEETFNQQPTMGNSHKRATKPTKEMIALWNEEIQFWA